MIIQHEKFVDLYNIDPLIFKKLLDRVTNVGTLFNRIDKLSSNYLEYGYSDKQTRRATIVPTIKKGTIPTGNVLTVKIKKAIVVKSELKFREVKV